MNYWYVARPNELFLDIDNPKRSLPHARARLQGAIECGKLDVAYVMQRPSQSQNRLHVIITIKGDSSPDSEFYTNETTRSVWEMIFHSDIYRGCCNVMRSQIGINAPRVLISPYPSWVDIIETGTKKHSHGYVIEATVEHVRHANDSCDCATKHNAATMETCPAAMRLRGEHRNAGLFGKPSKNPCTIWPEI